MPRTGGRLLIEQLAKQDVRHIFMVPGESFLDALDALHGHDSIRPVTCRHEGAAAMMAEATGKLTGTAGVAFVSRGPGAVNAMSGVYVASQDATPMVLLVGLPPRHPVAAPAFQHVDLTALFNPVTKWCAVVPDADSIASYVSRAFRIAADGRSGPVVLGLPEDILSDQTAANPVTPKPPRQRTPDREALAGLRMALAQAERPLVVVGGSEWSADAAIDLATFAERFDLPVIASFRRQDRLDNQHPSYAGHAGFDPDILLTRALRAADLVIAVGTRLGDVTSQNYRLFREAPERQRLFHIAPDADAPDSAYPHAERIEASAIAAIRALALMELPGKVPPWGVWRRDVRAAYLKSLEPVETPGEVKLEQVIIALSRLLRQPAIVTNGAGNYAAFLHHYFRYQYFPSCLAPVSGSMGYGLPAAIAAKLAFPDRQVVALAGDGCFQLTMAELATAVQFDLPIVVIVADNGMLGTIRMQQERRFPGRVVASTLVNPDFVRLAASYGVHAERIGSQDSIEPALLRAINADGPAMLVVAMDGAAISRQQSLMDLQKASGANTHS